MQTEVLERRRLLSVSLDSGVLTILGTNEADVISVRISGNNLVVTDNGVATSYLRTQVSLLEVQLFGGDDSFSAKGLAAAMNIDAGDGDDLVVAGNGADTIHSGDGNDTLWGNGGNDRFTTGAGTTLVYGGPGNDTLAGGEGADKFFGGVGMDTADYSAYTTGVVVRIDTAANDGVEGEGDNIALDVERVIGSKFDDKLYGGNAAVQLFGNNGNDVLVAARAGSLLHGGNGNDRLAGRSGNDTLIGAAGNDSLDGGLGSDELRGGDGIDIVSYAKRTAPIRAYISGLFESGEEGENDLIGLDVEALNGGSGDDLLVGSDGPETFYGMAGNDTIDGGWGDDTLWGGPGIDTADYSSRSMIQQLRIGEGSGIPGERDIPHEDIEVLIGGSGNDWIQGGAADNLLIGNGGDDTIIGMGGNDTLIGGPGADLLGYDITGGPSSEDGDAGDDVIYTFDLFGNDDGSIDRISDIVGDNVLNYSLLDPDELLLPPLF